MRRGSVVVRQIGPDEILVETPERRVIAASECPHRKGRMRFGRVDPKRMSITCPLHYSTFDLLTGQQLSGPPCGPLRVSVAEHESPR
ncbi:Rieske (2Fe-2S) protein [Actinoalloteichus hymeniacidonis]|uniref:Ferredoxin subunit of nitrite reductase and ring-hydroxylating dioxygenase n=1 Tax=Actinoalloteichus hymeniacidonis TaxID=340345 RepID=A0AAC9HS24_9PSEU|nr:Rieske (2Fe-2S) protein [Actinoalloteichus hymeniacidonis]AOS64617.1 ferredoxin subunit of nitrite reductase and ring-hydroxylating dioxygenase [Actinoalloteichus hymeniacidonis]MBB5907310.1 nitrite reductase (NADH) small subunit [Actinoalloteichus hymeniacidonis]